MKYDFTKPLGQRRPKIMERRPDAPPPTSFAIDEAKLRSALPQPTSSTMEDVKWSSAFLGMGLFWLALVAVIGWLLVRGLLALL